MLMAIGAFLVGLPLFFSSLATNAAVHHGHSPDAWWLWLTRFVLAAASVILVWKVAMAAPGKVADGNDKAA